ncbi:5,6-dimethylbenzimidazole synthase, partial [Streptomyces sp. SID5785]|nr:5,6-dimethylbenzimidazole synthase [Streptomyces sp. SID5785]
MTETGQVPGEGLPESAGVDQQGVPAPGAYTYLDPAEAVTEDDELLLMPGSQGAWGQPQAAAFAGAPQPQQPGPAAVHEPGPHEMAGRDSGHHDLGALQMPQAAAPAAGQSQGGPRRPLHMGPPVPEAGTGPVRSLADRGPAQATPPHAMPLHQSGPPTVGPEYLDVPPQGAAPWQPAGVQAEPQQAGYEQPVEAPVAPVAPAAPAMPAETVVPDPTAPYADGSGQPGQFPQPQMPGGGQEFQPAPEQPVAAYAGQPEQASYAAAPQPQQAQPFVGEQTIGQFVPVEGQVPTTPHLAPTPPRAMVVPPLPEASVAPEPVDGSAAEPVAETGAGQPLPEPAAEPVREQRVQEQPIPDQQAADQPVVDQQVPDHQIPDDQSVPQPAEEHPPVLPVQEQVQAQELPLQEQAPVQEAQPGQPQELQEPQDDARAQGPQVQEPQPEPAEAAAQDAADAVDAADVPAGPEAVTGEPQPVAEQPAPALDGLDAP